VSNDGGEIIVVWFPPEHRASTVSSCDDLCWIAQSARCDLHLEVDTGNALDHLNHLTHRETMAVSAIKRQRGTAGAQIAQPGRMRTDKLANVNVIANASTIRRPIQWMMRNAREVRILNARYSYSL
jgi:hypothetical protein